MAVYSFTSVLLKAPRRMPRPAACDTSASPLNTPNHRLGHRPLGAYRPRWQPIDTRVCEKKQDMECTIKTVACKSVSM